MLPSCYIGRQNILQSLTALSKRSRKLASMTIQATSFTGRLKNFELSRLSLSSQISCDIYDTRDIAFSYAETAFTRCRHILKMVENVTDRPSRLSIVLARCCIHCMAMKGSLLILIQKVKKQL